MNNYVMLLLVVATVTMHAQEKDGCAPLEHKRARITIETTSQGVSTARTYKTQFIKNGLGALILGISGSVPLINLLLDMKRARSPNNIPKPVTFNDELAGALTTVGAFHASGYLLSEIIKHEKTEVTVKRDRQESRLFPYRTTLSGLYLTASLYQLTNLARNSVPEKLVCIINSVGSLYAGLRLLSAPISQGDVTMNVQGNRNSDSLESLEATMLTRK